MALLRQYGALDPLPDLSTIRIQRPGSSVWRSAFSRDTNGLNHFSLLQAIARVYLPQAIGRFQLPGFQSQSSPALDFPFPDFSRIRILRPLEGQLGESANQPDRSPASHCDRHPAQKLRSPAR